MDTKKQLIHIKQLYLRSENLARKTDDVSLIMLTQLLDFSVETFIKLVISSFPKPANFLGLQKDYYYKITQLENERYKPDMDFYRAWDEVIGIIHTASNGISITNLPLRRDMDRLHEIRNDVQHKGALPNIKDLLKYIPLVQSFFIDSYQGIFNVDFEKLSALSLIQDPKVKQRLEQAYEYLEKEEWTKAFCDAVLAFHFLLQLVRNRAYVRQVQDTSPIHDTYYNGVKFDLTSSAQHQANANLFREIERLKDHIAIIGFGVDYADYTEIEPSLPELMWDSVEEDGKLKIERKVKLSWEYSEQLHQWVQEEYTETDATKIIHFVEKQALELQV